MGISNIKDWCIALNKDAPTLKQYEDKLYNFYKSRHENTDYDNARMVECYKKTKTSSVVIRSLFSKFWLKLLLSLMAGICCWFIEVFTKDGQFLDKIKEYGKNSITISVVVMLLTLGIILFINGIITMSAHSSAIHSLSKLEEQLTPLMKTVPASYRNYDKISTIAKVYFAKPTINPTIILNCVDEYLNSNGYESKFTAVMFDLPCNCPFLGNCDNLDTITNIENQTNQENSAEDNTPKNAYLPSDIENKVIVGSTDSDKDLNNMIGLQSVKDQIKRLKSRIEFYGKDVKNNGCHMAFLGSAGTGKTSVARIVTKILFDLGYIKKNQYIEISGDYLCAGSTSRASAIIEYSYGGVLFIDEAYLMYGNGSDIIGVLLKAMEDHRDDFVVILAGYEEQMTKLFASNEGFTSRIKNTIYFPDYTEEEMLDIFNYFLKNYNGKAYRVDNEAIPLLISAFKLEKKAKSFGNARTVRNAVDMIMDYYADRSIEEKSDTRIIMEADIMKYFNNRKNVLQHEIKNASAADQIDESIIRLAELKPRLKPGADDPDEALKSLIGLESIKDEINALKNEKEFYGKAQHQKILLIGDEGCGKTSLTEVITGYLYQLGYIEENKYLDISADFLKGSFVGHTAKRAEAIISYASGGVLYIRNYNSLIKSEDAFTLEVINALAVALTKRDDITIIFADSDSKAIRDIENLFTLVYEFPKYTPDQLLRIFDSKARAEEFIVEESARQKLLAYITTNNSTINDIQQIYNSTVKNHISNFDGTDENKFFISEKDLVLPTKKLKLNLNLKK